MNKINQNFKMIILALMYWLFFVFIPGFIMFKLRYEKISLDISGYIALYILLIAPFLFFLPFKLARIEKNKIKIYYVLLGLVIPFIVMYFFVYLEFKKNFNPMIL